MAESHAGIRRSAFGAIACSISDQVKDNLLSLYIVTEYMPFWDGWFWIGVSPRRRKGRREKIKGNWPQTHTDPRGQVRLQVRLEEKIYRPDEISAKEISLGRQRTQRPRRNY